MKKFLFSVFFVVLCFGSASTLKAQSYKDTASTTTKSDDGVLVVYPNPAKDFMLVKSKNTSLKIKSVAFYSILGMQVAEYSINQNSTELRLDKLKPGKYLMRYVLSDNTQKVTQIIKQ